MPTDWNWRLEPERGGELRAVGDIGSHWIDLTRFVTGLEVVEVFADLATAIPVGAGRSARSRRSRAPRTSSARTRPCPPRTSRTSSSASRTDRAGRASSPRYPAAVRTRCASRSTARRPRLRGTPSGTRSSGSATAAGRTRCFRGTRASCHRDRRTHAPPGRPRRGVRGHISRAVPRGVRGRRPRRALERARLSDLPRRPRRERARGRRRPVPPRGDAGWRCRHDAVVPPGGGGAGEPEGSPKERADASTGRGSGGTGLPPRAGWLGGRRSCMSLGRRSPVPAPDARGRTSRPGPRARASRCWRSPAGPPRAASAAATRGRPISTSRSSIPTPSAT